MAVHSLHTVGAVVKALVPYSAGPTVVASWDFESVSGNITSSAVTTSTTSPRNGTHSGSMTAAGNGYGVGFTVTGLVIGATYTFSAWVRLVSGTGSIGFGSVISPLPTATAASTTYAQRTVTFTAIATSQIISYQFTGASTVTYLFDDITVTRAAYTAYADYQLDVKSGSLTLDDTREPYINASITCAAPDAATLELITPLSGLRVVVTLAESFGTGTEWNPIARAATSRTFDLFLYSRTFDKGRAELSLELASDEQLLQAYRHPVSASERTYGLSIKAAVDRALGKIGATLAPDYDDANLTSKTLDPVLTNLHPNPTGQSLTAWSGSGTTTSKLTGLSLPQLPGVTTAVRGTMSAVTGGLYYVGDGGSGPYIPVTAGQQYTSSGWLRSSVDKIITPSVQWTNSGHTGQVTTAASPITLLANVWTYVSFTSTAPAGVAFAGPYWYSTTAWVSGQTLDGTGFMFELGSTAHPFFDGGNAGLGRDSTIYVPAWVGTPNASSSTLTEQPNSDSTVWQPGQSASDWLEPMLQQGNLRLWCDESRVWRLKKDWSSTDVVTVASSTGLTTASDTIGLDSSSEYYDHVVIAYTGNLNADGSTYTLWDIASSGTYLAGLVVEYPVPLPGAGAAQNVLNRALGKGRVMDVEAVSNYLATPGQGLTVTVPDAVGSQVGVLQAVAWDLATFTMRVTSRGLTSAPANAWLFAVGPWSAATGTWAGATGTN